MLTLILLVFAFVFACCAAAKVAEPVRFSFGWGAVATALLAALVHYGPGLTR